MMRRLPIALLLALLFGCGGPDSSARDYISAAVSDDANARAALSRGELEEARVALARLVDRPAPETVASEDVALIQRDACERIGRIEMRRDDLNAAEEWLERGLAIEGPDDLFLANLLTTRGRLHERRHEDSRAAAAYHRALTIEEALLNALLEELPVDEEEAP